MFLYRWSIPFSPPSASFRIFSLSLVSCIVTMICLGVDFLVFILLGVFYISWYVINFGKCQPHYHSYISSVPFFSLLLLLFPLYTCYAFCNCLSSWIFYYVLMFSLKFFFPLFAFQLRKFLLTHSQAHWFVFSALPSLLMSLSKVILTFC